MKKVCANLMLTLISFSFLFTSCKEYEKKKILAQEEALKEINNEREQQKREEFMSELEILRRQDEEATKMEGETTPRGQQKIMENDTSFTFSKNEYVGFDYEIITKKKFTLTNDKSETEGKYLLYKEGKKIGAEGIIKYKMGLNQNNFYVEGQLVKKK